MKLKLVIFNWHAISSRFLACHPPPTDMETPTPSGSRTKSARRTSLEVFAIASNEMIFSSNRWFIMCCLDVCIFVCVSKKAFGKLESLPIFRDCFSVRLLKHLAGISGDDEDHMIWNWFFEKVRWFCSQCVNMLLKRNWKYANTAHTWLLVHLPKSISELQGFFLQHFRGAAVRCRGGMVRWRCTC